MKDETSQDTVKVSFKMSADLFDSLNTIVEESVLPTMTEHLNIAVAQYVFLHLEEQRGKMIVIEDLSGHGSRLLLPERRAKDSS